MPTEFDIEFMAPCFFENIHLLLILKCFVTLSGVVIDCCSCLCMLFDVCSKEVLVFINPICGSPYGFFIKFA